MKSHIDWDAVVFIIVIFMLIVLFAGEPDLLDAIIHRMMN